MSFLQNLRHSISGKNNSSRGSTPLSHRSSSADSTSMQRDSLERKADALKRSETFTIETHETLEDKGKASKAEKILNKFSTFTKRKKAPAPKPPVTTAQKNSSKTPCHGAADLSEEAQDPFHFLYEQPSSLKSNSSHASSHGGRRPAPINYSTYRKNHVPRPLWDQLEQLKNQPEISEETENDPNDKFRTITINSYRKSFRNNFLAKQNKVPHNPAWFVEVDPDEPDHKSNSDQPQDPLRRLFVYENENYRPSSRSPKRNRSPLSNISPVRSISPTRCASPAAPKIPVNKDPPQVSQQHTVRPTARSSAKRTDTFKVERSLMEPSIRIQIKNSINRNQPMKVVPVGVAKPMPVQHPVSRDQSPINGKSYKQSVQSKFGRYQTYVQITSDDCPNAKKGSTHIQISGTSRSPHGYMAPTKSHLTARRQNISPEFKTKDAHFSVRLQDRQYNQYPDTYTHSRSSKPPSGLFNDSNRSYMTQAIPRRSQSPIKAPWR